MQVNYVSSLMEFQDELDRHDQSLWGLNSDKPLDIDKDCLSCSLDKYRPQISEAFKLACIQYQPSKVPFQGQNYLRKSLINAKEKMLLDTWDFGVNNITFFKKVGKDFLPLLDEKLKEDKIEGFCKIDDEIVNRKLEEQLLKHDSNYGHLFEQLNDKESLVDMKLSLAESSVESLFRTQSVQKVDRKTHSIIKMLKSTQMQKKKFQSWRRRSQGEVDELKGHKLEIQPKETQSAVKEGQTSFSPPSNREKTQSLLNKSLHQIGPICIGSLGLPTDKQQYSVQRSVEETKEDLPDQKDQKVQNTTEQDEVASSQIQTKMGFALPEINTSKLKLQNFEMKIETKRSSEMNEPLGSKKKKAFKPRNETSQDSIWQTSSFSQSQLRGVGYIPPAMNFKDVLSQIPLDEKQELLKKMQDTNKKVKRLDQQAVVKGSTRNLRYSQSKDIEPSLKIESTIKGSTGYLYSHNLIENLRSPHSKKDPLKQLKQMFEQKNREIQRQRDQNEIKMMNIKPDKKQKVQTLAQTDFEDLPQETEVVKKKRPKEKPSSFIKQNYLSFENTQSKFDIKSLRFQLDQSKKQIEKVKQEQEMKNDDFLNPQKPERQNRRAVLRKQKDDKKFFEEMHIQEDSYSQRDYQPNEDYAQQILNLQKIAEGASADSLSKKSTFRIKDGQVSSKSNSRVNVRVETKRDLQVTGLSTSKISADWEFQGGKNFNKMFKRGSVAAVPNVQVNADLHQDGITSVTSLRKSDQSSLETLN